MPIKQIENLRVFTILTVETMKVGQSAFMSISQVLFFEEYVTVKLTSPVYTKKKEGNVYVQITRTGKGLSCADYTISFENVSKDYFLYFHSRKTLEEIKVFKDHYLWFAVAYVDDIDESNMTPAGITARIQYKEKQLERLASCDDFEQAIRVRDEISVLKNRLTHSL